MNDLVGGHIPIVFDTLTTVLPEAAAGNIRVLAVTSLYMPAAKINLAYTTLVKVMRDILASSAIKEKFATQGIDPSQFAGSFVDAEIKKLGAANVRPQE